MTSLVDLKTKEKNLSKEIHDAYERKFIPYEALQELRKVKKEIASMK